MLRTLSLALFLLAACHSSGETPPAPQHGSVQLPASALAGAVRALETIDAVRPPGALTQVRAIECDTMTDPASKSQVVRAFLHLTVFAPTTDRAREAFEQIRAALETEAHASARTEPATEEQVRRALVYLDWNPPGDEHLASFSDRVRLEIAPGRTVAETPIEANMPETPYAPIEAYIRAAAVRENFGQLDIRVAQSGDELRFLIAESSQHAHTREAISRFLSALESGSPAVRLTKVKIEPSPTASSPGVSDAWTLEAEMTVVDAVKPAAAGGQ